MQIRRAVTLVLIMAVLLTLVPSAQAAGNPWWRRPVAAVPTATPPAIEASGVVGSQTVKSLVVLESSTVVEPETGEEIYLYRFRDVPAGYSLVLGSFVAAPAVSSCFSSVAPLLASAGPYIIGTAVFAGLGYVLIEAKYGRGTVAEWWQMSEQVSAFARAQLKAKIQEKVKAKGAAAGAPKFPCNPLPSPDLAYTRHMAKSGHTESEVKEALELIAQGSKILYTVDPHYNNGNAVAAYQSLKPNAFGQYGYQFWNWDANTQSWQRDSTYLRPNLGEPLRSKGSPKPPSNGCPGK
jgi:hypothetical protein